MADPSMAPAPLPSLQFDKAEFVDNRPKCVMCKSAIESEYYHVAGQVACASCAERTRQGQQSPKNPWVLRGVLYGAVAAVVCSIGYAIITYVTNYELALIAILVGYIIGRAVRIGSHGLGGRRLQITAVVLTYLSITTSYIPLLIKGMSDGYKARHAATAQTGQSTASVTTGSQSGSSPATVPNTPSRGRRAASGLGLLIAIVIIVGIAIISPFLGLTMGVSGIIGIAIIFFGLSRAWRETARDERLVMGPYHLEQEPSPSV